MRKKRYRHRDKLKLIHKCIKHYKRFEESLNKLDNELTKRCIKHALNCVYGTPVSFGNVLYNDTDSTKSTQETN